MALPVGFTQTILDMIDGEPPESVITSAGNRAVLAIKSYGVADNDPNYNLALSLYTCHLLWINGHARTASSKSTGDMSVGYDPQVMGDKEGASPYIWEFRKFFMAANIFVYTI